MGTHPIFESDFDCLTDGFRSYLQLFDWCQWGDYCARSSSRTNRWLGADRGWIILKSWGANQITSERIERKNPEAEKYEENKRLGESTELQQIPEEWACHLAAWHFEELKKASPNKQNCNPATIPQVSASQQILSLCDNHNYLNPTKSSHLFKLWAFIACIAIFNLQVDAIQCWKKSVPTCNALIVIPKMPEIFQFSKNRSWKWVTVDFYFATLSFDYTLFYSIAWWFFEKFQFSLRQNLVNFHAGKSRSFW